MVKEFDWSCVEAELGKIAGYNGKTYSVRYGLILAQCEAGTTKVEERIILKSDVFHPQTVHQMWAYIRCYMNEGPERLQEVKPFPRDVNFRRCLFGFFPFLDPTEDGRRIRAGMGRSEMIFSVAIASVLALALFWLFVPIGICEYIAQRLAPKPKWPTEVVQQTALHANVTASLEPRSDNVKCSCSVNHLRRRKIFKTDAKLPVDIAYVKWIDANGVQLLTSALRGLKEDGDTVPIPGAILDTLLPS